MKTQMRILSYFILLLTTAFICSGQTGINNASENIIADAHIHEGFIWDDNKVKLSNFEYFNHRDVDVLGFPMPVDKSGTDDLPNRITEEVNKLRALSKLGRKFSIIGRGDSLIEGNVKSVILTIEYFNEVFGGNPENVRVYKNAGISSITLIEDSDDEYFDDNRLTDFGKEIIKKMNEAGIVIDISHLTDEQRIKVIEYSDSPVIASHSCAAGVTPRSNNLSDEVLEKLRDNNGLVFVKFNINDLYGESDRSIDGVTKFITHLDHVKNIVGADHTGIGSDYQERGAYVPGELNKPETYRLIEKRLRAKGYSEKEIRGIMGTNFLRALGISY